MGAKTSNKWQGELGPKLDSYAYRAKAFDAWLSWEYLQRGVAHCREAMSDEEIAELCGKRRFHIFEMWNATLKQFD